MDLLGRCLVKKKSCPFPSSLFCTPPPPIKIERADIPRDRLWLFPTPPHLWLGVVCSAAKGIRATLLQNKSQKNLLRIFFNAQFYFIITILRCKNLPDSKCLILSGANFCYVIGQLGKSFQIVSRPESFKNRRFGKRGNTARVCQPPIPLLELESKKKSLSLSLSPDKPQSEV